MRWRSRRATRSDADAQDIDAAWKRAVEAGCEVVMPLEVMFWGDR